MDVTGTDTVTLVRREVAGRDRYGNDVLVDTEIVVPHCAFQPMWGAEITGDADRITERYILLVPGLALTDLEIDPQAIDSIRAYGLAYEINGEPQIWRTPQGIDHLVIYCRRITG
jgi:hypothetical protein